MEMSGKCDNEGLKGHLKLLQPAQQVIKRALEKLLARSARRLKKMSFLILCGCPWQMFLSRPNEIHTSEYDSNDRRLKISRSKFVRLLAEIWRTKKKQTKT